MENENLQSGIGDAPTPTTPPEQPGVSQAIPPTPPTPPEQPEVSQTIPPTPPTPPEQPGVSQTIPPTPPTPPEQPEVPPKTEITKTEEIPGFGGLFKMSFKLFTQNWLSLIKLTFIYLLPLIVIGGLIYFFVGRASAAPGIPTTETATTEEIADVDIETATLPPTEENGMEGIVETIDENFEDADSEPVSDTEIAEVKAMELPTPTLYDENNVFTTTDATVVNDSADLNIQFLGGGSGALIGMLGLATGAMLVIMLLLMIPIWLYGGVAILSHVKLIVTLSQSSEIQIGEIVKWGFKKLGSFIMLNIRIFIYTLAWVQFLIAFAQPFIIKILGFSGMGIVGLASFVVGIIVFIRTLRVYFSIYVLAERDCTSKEALDESISTSKGHLGKIFGYGLLFGLIFSVVPIIAVLLLGGNEIPIILIYFITMIFAVYIGMFFFYGLYNVCKMEDLPVGGQPQT